MNKKKQIRDNLGNFVICPIVEPISSFHQMIKDIESEKKNRKFWKIARKK